jgi:GNAT superfamily N-acetyltransferase
MIDKRLLDDLAETMFTSDAQGRLTGPAPLLHIIRTHDHLIVRLHAALTDEIASKLRRRAGQPRGRAGQWARDYAVYLEILRGVGQLAEVRAGPLYVVSGLRNPSPDVVLIGPGNLGLLRDGLDEWLPDVEAGLPMAAVVQDGRAVSICASVRASPRVHCAGVETLPDHRGQGLAVRAVAAWAQAVQALGAAPFYGTTFDNLASQGVARRLGLTLIGSEFSIACELA